MCYVAQGIEQHYIQKHPFTFTELTKQQRWFDPSCAISHNEHENLD